VAVAVVAAVAVEVVGMMIMMGTSFYSSAGLTAEG